MNMNREGNKDAKVFFVPAEEFRDLSRFTVIIRS